MDLFTNQPTKPPKEERKDEKPRLKCECRHFGGVWELCEEGKRLQKAWIKNLNVKDSINYMKHFKK